MLTATSQANPAIQSAAKAKIILPATPVTQSGEEMARPWQKTAAAVVQR
jgi:hypothetical protein